LTSGNESRELKKWHVPDLSLIATFTNNDPDTGLPPEVDDSEFSPDDQLIADSDIFGVKLRNATDGSLIRKITNAELVSIAFSPDGTLIAFSPEPGVFAYTQFGGGVTVSFARFIR